MNKIKAFVGHSFAEDDEPTIAVFLNYFNSLKDIGFEWDTAERAEPKNLSVKVREKMEGKNLFIGIFTAKNKQIEPSKLKQNVIFRRGCLSGREEDFQWNTSDWIIQESGYALGKGMGLIFIVEKGLTSVGGLQGDLNYISFSRSNPELCFKEVNEMITALMRVRKESLVTEETKEKTNVYAPEESKKPMEEEEKKDSFVDLLKAIKENNEKEEREIFKIYLEETSKGDKYKEIESTCWYFWLRYRFGGKNIFDDLNGLSKENPENPCPYFWLGKLFEEYKNYEKAAGYFLIASKHANNKSLLFTKNSCICRAAEALRDAKKYNDAKIVLLDQFQGNNKESYQELHELFRILGDVELKDNNIEHYFAFTEKALELNPSDNNLRFELASRYHENKKYQISLYHYKILCDTSPNSANWNNLGVDYAELYLSGKAVSAYKKSQELGGTTAVGNLAHKLTDAGFLEEAKIKLEEVLKKESYDSNVPDALASIEKVYKSEKEKEKEILSSIESEYKFRIDYAEAFAFPCQVKLPAKWSSKYCELKVKIEGNKFIASGEVKLKSGLGLAGLLASSRLGIRESALPREQLITKEFKYTGIIINRAVNYTLKVTTAYSDSTIKNPEEILTGQMIIEIDCKTIKVFEKDNKENISFYEMNTLP
jgi:hypothetical protein